MIRGQSAVFRLELYGVVCTIQLIGPGSRTASCTNVKAHTVNTVCSTHTHTQHLMHAADDDDDRMHCDLLCSPRKNKKKTRKKETHH